MKTKRIKKMLISILFITLCATLIYASSIFVSGYKRYRSVSVETPITEVVSNLQQQTNYIDVDSVSSNFLTPLIAIEDPEFYEHSGFRVMNIMEALFNNMKASTLVEGGSTITQQLSKNIFLDQRKEFSRKVAELFFASDLEKMYDKDEILEFYINSSYYGDGYYGIYDASMGYFQVEPKDLTLAQGSMLAGLLQAPSAYQLSSGYELAKQRQRIVLDEMVEQGIISEEIARDIWKVSLLY